MNRRLKRIGIIASASLLIASLGLAGCQSGGDAKEDAAPTAPVKEEPKGPAVIGPLESQPISGLGFQRAVLTLDVQPSGEVSGVLQGGYDDKPFEVFVTGKVGPDGVLRATGEGSDGTAKLEGLLEASGFSGEITGDIFTEQFSLPMAAPSAEASMADSD